MTTGNLGLVLVLLFLQSARILCDDFKKPTVLIGILVRNKAHTLPYFLSFLENLKYPKERISLWIRSDNNIDKSIEILNTWLEQQKTKYHAVDFLFDDKSKGFDDEKGIADWSPTRFSNIIKLREEAVHHARKIWADFIFMLDADVFLTNPNTLDHLVSKNLTVIAPLLKSDGMYSNFWAGMTPDYYYMRTDRYKPILRGEDLGCFAVPMVHTAVLVDLRRKMSSSLTYSSENLENFDGPRDDIITFALAANRSGVPLHICNDHIYGFITVPLDNREGIDHDKQQMTNIKLEILAFQESLPLSENLNKFVSYPKKDTMSMSNIYMINLLRRPERRRRMQNCFDELGIAAEVIDAVDGRTLNHTILKSMGITLMSGYADPYHKRPMTMGEIGCFLSHYHVWNKVIEKNYESVMVLEDDVRFEPYFRQKVHFVLNELQRLNMEWDLVYIGRKRMQEQEEPLVQGSQYLVHAGYSYWTLGYILSARGAKKLLAAQPLKNMVPVDEYLPILFDKHPRFIWKEQFPERNLVALSAAPLLVYPTHYTGESGYISDTEDSKVVASKAEAANMSNSREEL
ncbi:glycosyltransferase 25 family member-like isoform X2 [Belonocnema kinseyi]|uniref:glycosyltransferase 25 family member-like isoform X2 n=1 Tax=Belonocnema kinseyi TaxID=2817044 RepID=UPI00143CD36D|nr:glycosyltransferase 25 family member-like isoform X2 [Belonocnema kinseyi]